MDSAVTRRVKRGLRNLDLSVWEVDALRLEPNKGATGVVRASARATVEGKALDLIRVATESRAAVHEARRRALVNVDVKAPTAEQGAVPRRESSSRRDRVASEASGPHLAAERPPIDPPMIATRGWARTAVLRTALAITGTARDAKSSKAVPG